MQDGPRILILVGSDSDLPAIDGCTRVLDELGVGWELHVASAHRTPDKAMGLASEARERGFGAVIAAAGLAAHLPGVVAACTTLPVIGVPLASGPLAGADALHSVVQMPPGIPVATVAIDGTRNAGILGAQVLSAGWPQLVERLEEFRARLRAQVAERDAKVVRRSSEPAIGSRVPVGT